MSDQQKLIVAVHRFLDEYLHPDPSIHELDLMLEELQEALRQAEWSPLVGDYVIADCDITRAMLTYIDSDHVYIAAGTSGRIHKLIMWGNELASVEVEWGSLPPVYHDFRILRDWLRLR